MVAVLLLTFAWVLPRGCDLLWGNVAMVAYGQVVDQSNHAVEGAAVELTASRQARFQLPILFSQDGIVHWTVDAVTAADGSFVVNAGRGQALDVRSIKKPGYVQSKLGGGRFIFAINQPRLIYHPDSKHPVIFMMWNSALRRVVSREVICRAIGDDVFQTLEYVSGRVERAQGGFEELKFRLKYPSGNPRAPYDWELEVGGGMQGEVAEAKGSSKDEAPMTGYLPTLRFLMKADNPHWSSTISRRFYTHGKYSEVYAAVELTAKLGMGGQPATVTIKYTASYDGSRSLKPGPVQPAGK
jgi:hypothetical protein